MKDTLGGLRGCTAVRRDEPGVFVYEATFGGLEGIPRWLCRRPIADGASVKRISAHGGCLGTNRRRRTWQAAKSLGELQASIDPGMSEWGNPARVVPRHPEREANPGN